MTVLQIAASTGFIELFEVIHKQRGLDITIYNSKNQTLKEASALSTISHKIID